MIRTDTCIFLKDVHFHAFHGVALQEQEVGNDFRVDVCLKYDFQKAALSDEVSDAVNYASVYEVIKAEMLIPSKLLEHVCNRIVNHLFNAFPSVVEIHITLAKQNPPMGADIKEAGVKMDCIRTVGR